MDDDTKQYKIQFKGTAYTFMAIPEDDIVMITTVANMGASPLKAYKALLRVLGASAGKEQWDAITDRLIAKEVGINDFSDLFTRLMNKQRKDMASVQADDAE